MRGQRLLWRLALALGAGLLCDLCGVQGALSTAGAQAVPTAVGPGSNLTVGGGISAYQAVYGERHLEGGFVYADANPHWRIGFEGEARSLRYHTFEDVTQTTYLGGVRVLILRPHRLQPYAKFLAGVGKITLPFDYAHGAFLAYAPGAGLDIALNHYVTVRAIDVEYQHWPQFNYGPLNPYGVSSGISVRLNPLRIFPGSRERVR